MKKMIYLLMVICTGAVAQNNIEKAGPDLNKDDVPHFKNIIGSDDNSFYTLRTDPGAFKSTYRVEQFSKIDLNSIKQVATITFKKFTEYHFSRIVKDKLFFVTKQYNTGDKKCELTIDEFSTNAANTESKNRILIMFDTDNTKWYQTIFQYASSPDDSKIAVIATYINDVTFHLYDAYTFKEISSKKVTQLPAKMMVQYTLDNEGNLLYSYKDGNAFKIVKQFSGAVKDLVASVKMNPAYSYDPLEIYQDVKNNQVYVYSVFYEKSKNEKLDGASNGGFYIGRMDPKTMTVASEKYHAFSNEVLDKIKCGKPDGLINEYSPKLTILDNSDLLLEGYNTGRSSRSRGTGTGSYDMSQKISYNADEIVVAKLTPALELSWMKFIPRSIVYTNITNGTESTIEFSKLVTGNSIKYIFIEHPKFELKKINYASCTECDVPNIATYPNTNVVEYSLDLSGKLNKRILYVNKDDNWLIPKLYNMNMGENKYLVRFRKKKEESFGIINLK